MIATRHVCSFPGCGFDAADTEMGRLSAGAHKSRTGHAIVAVTYCRCGLINPGPEHQRHYPALCSDRDATINVAQRAGDELDKAVEQFMRAVKADYKAKALALADAMERAAEVLREHAEKAGADA